MDDLMASAVAGSTAMASAEVQAQMGIAMAKKAMEFQGDMTLALINGGDAARNAGLAAEGIGGKLNIVA